MSNICYDFLCSNRTELGSCKLTACVKPATYATDRTTIPTTVADVIRSMNDNDLCQLLVNTAYYYDAVKDEDYWFLPRGSMKTNYRPTAEGEWLKWLQKSIRVGE